MTEELSPQQLADLLALASKHGLTVVPNEPPEPEEHISDEDLSEEEMRNLFVTRKKPVIPFKESLPGLERLDGRLGLVELSANDITHAEKLSLNENDESDDAVGAAALFAKSLVRRSTGKRIFNDNDLETIMDFGLSVYLPVIGQAKSLSKLIKDAIEKAKKNSVAVPGGDFNTSSTETSELPVQV